MKGNVLSIVLTRHGWDQRDYLDNVYLSSGWLSGVILGLELGSVWSPLLLLLCAGDVGTADGLGVADDVRKQTVVTVVTNWNDCNG